MKRTILFAFGNYVTDKESFYFDGSGARHGETPNIAMDAGSENLANIIASGPDYYEACKNLPVPYENGQESITDYNKRVLDWFWLNASAVHEATKKAEGKA